MQNSVSTLPRNGHVERRVSTPRRVKVANHSTGQQVEPACGAVLKVGRSTASGQLRRGVANRQSRMPLPYLQLWDDGTRNPPYLGKSDGMRTGRNAKSVQFVEVPEYRTQQCNVMIAVMRRAQADDAAWRLGWNLPTECRHPPFPFRNRSAESKTQDCEDNRDGGPLVRGDWTTQFRWWRSFENPKQLKTAMF